MLPEALASHTPRGDCQLPVLNQVLGEVATICTRQTSLSVLSCPPPPPTRGGNQFPTCGERVRPAGVTLAAVALHFIPARKLPIPAAVACHDRGQQALLGLEPPSFDRGPQERFIRNRFGSGHFATQGDFQLQDLPA